jgi:RHS repeat-associated protein
VYRADGLKVKKIYGTKTTDYLDGFQYENNTLQFIPTAEGYFDFTKNAYIYNYVDHLGNVRLSYYKNSAGVLTTLEENNYYPFGMKHDGYNTLTGNPSYQYKYQGQELQETGMYDYGARMYMPDIGRWGVVDPLAEKYRRMSPYSYAADNPIRYVDYDGRDYGIYIDFKKGTITVKGTYYATANDMKSANGGAKQWNDISGKYNYIYKDANGNKISLKVNFQLTTSEVTPGKGQTTKQAVCMSSN